MWAAIAVATIVQIVAYGSFLLALVATDSETPEAAGPAFALAFGLVPIVFAAAAFISGHPRAPTATLKGMGLWLVVALPAGLVNPVAGLTAGFGVGGAAALRADYFRPWRPRLVAVLASSLYVLFLVVVIPAAGILTGAVAPLLAVKIGDMFAERGSSGEQAETG